MNLNYSRSERVAELVRREIAQIIIQHVNDPRLKSVTVTRTKLSPDLRVAKVFVSSITQEEQEQVLKGLNRARNFIRGELGRNLKLRRTPELVFKWDDSVDYSFHIAEVITDLKKTGHKDPGEEEEK